MRTILTIDDIKNIIETIFNGNLRKSKISGETYKNPNDVPAYFTNGNKTEQKSLAKYLNIEFYTWQKRLEEYSEQPLTTNIPPQSVLPSWVQSLNLAFETAYALVEQIDEEATASQDIDSSVILGKVSFLIQANKINNLSYYITKLRNQFLGVPQDIQNSFGDTIKAFIMLGFLSYEQEPFQTQIGQCVIATLNFRVSYLADALTFKDNKIEISLNGDDLYNANGEIVDALGNPTTTKYLTMPITKATFQAIFSSNPVPVQERPDLTGVVVSAVSSAKTLSFYDYNKPLTQAFNDLFWQQGAYRVNGKLSSIKDVNVPIYIRVISGENSYVYKDVIDNMQKDLTNNDFNICSITTKGWGKIQPQNLNQGANINGRNI